MYHHLRIELIKVKLTDNPLKVFWLLLYMPVTIRLDTDTSIGINASLVETKGCKLQVWKIP